MLANHNSTNLGPTLRFVVQDRRLIELLATSEICDFDEKIKLRIDDYIPFEKNEELDQSVEQSVEKNVSLETNESIEECQFIEKCENVEWCPISLFRFRSMASEFRPCNLNFSFHIAAITHKMLNIYENEGEETDLHDFLTNKDLCIMSRHQSDEDEDISLIFQPKYKIRPNAEMVRQKLKEYIDTENMSFNVDISEDGDYFSDAWNVKSNLFLSNEEESPKSKKVKKS